MGVGGRPGSVPTDHPWYLTNVTAADFDPTIVASATLPASYADPMPVIVIGADTPVGRKIVPALKPASGELRVFVSDDKASKQLRKYAKVAVGDVSDGSHVGGAALGAFCAVAILDAARDGRDRSFADSPQAVLAQWADGLRDAGVQRVIVVGDGRHLPAPDPLAGAAPEYRFVEVRDRAQSEITAEVKQHEATDRLS